MAVRLARHARRRLQLARDRRRRLLELTDSVISSHEQPQQETSPLAPLVIDFIRRFSRCQDIYIMITLGCLFVFWFPSVHDSSFRRSLKNAECLNHHLNLSNNIKPPAVESSSSLVFDFIDEDLFPGLVAAGYAGIALMSMVSHHLRMFLPEIETIEHYRLLGILRRSIGFLIFSSIFGQLVSSFVDRPLDMLGDLPLNSLLVVQIIGFLLSVFSSFIIGVIYASVQQSKALLRTS